MIVNTVPLTDGTRRGYPWYSVILGAVVFIVGCCFLYGPISLAANHAAATATVTYVDGIYSQRSASTSYFAHVRFIDVDGDRHTGSLPPVYSSSVYSDGDRVPILYNRANPTQVVAAGDGGAISFVWSGIAVILGALWFILGVVFVRRQARTAAATDATAAAWPDGTLMASLDRDKK